ncbi:MAG TPA: DNA damage-inducible protein D [Candidatus Absconditabacterales bacterium]|nr:DNA damage-inducible protein D [Candidatus Absconditabacterales bacterium]
MDKFEIESMMKDFESFVSITPDGVEFRLARDLQKLLGYTKWDNFLEVIKKAEVSCNNSGYNVSDHFADVGKVVQLGSNAQREISDIMLTRYACYLIAQNGDSRKAHIAFAQTYFAIQTRKFEVIQQKLSLQERIIARKKLSETEKELSKVIFEQTNSNKNFATIRSKGDTALFGKTTQEMKEKRQIKGSKPLADFMPTLLLKAKDFATEITIYNAVNNNMSTENQISQEHITNNSSVRETLIGRGIKPEDIKPQEDIKKVERRLQSENKKSLKNIKKLK